MEKVGEFFRSAWGWVKDNPIVSSLVALTVAVVVVVAGVFFAKDDSLPEVDDLASPKVDVQGDNGSSVVSGGGRKNSEVATKSATPNGGKGNVQAQPPLPDIPPVQPFIPKDEVKPQDIAPPKPQDIPQNLLEEKPGHKGQESVGKFIPGEGSDKVDTRPRPAPARGPQPKPNPQAQAPQPAPAQGEPKKTKPQAKPGAPAPAQPAPQPKPADKPMPHAEAPQPEMANTIEVKGQRFPMVPGGVDGDSFSPPENPALVGWWQDSAEAGTDQPGSVVVSSHIDYAGQDGVGKIFLTLKPGDVVTLWNTKGVKTSWRVTKIYPVDKTGDMAPVVNKIDGPQVLVMVTCGGKPVGPPLYYSDNIITEAEPVI